MSPERVRSAFFGCLTASVVTLLAIDLYFGPRALAVETAPITSTTASSHAPPPIITATPSSKTIAKAPPPPEPAPEPAPPSSKRLTGVVVRFESERDQNTNLGELKTLAEQMLAQPEYDVILEGHSDANGNEYYNLSLSLDRANWARDRLADYGVSKARIRTTGLGSARPLGEADPESPSNRRVEVRWIKRGLDGGKN